MARVILLGERQRAISRGKARPHWSQAKLEFLQSNKTKRDVIFKSFSWFLLWHNNLFIECTVQLDWSEVFSLSTSNIMEGYICTSVV